ncbi:MAG: flavoprotein [Lentisphaeria bacterium]
MTQRTITVGITGSIAAYKAADIVSQLIKNNFNVRVIMTESAMQLITPMTFFTLSQNPVITSLWEVPDWKPGHISLADQTDLFVVVPATANFIGKYTNGIADDALTTFALSYDGKVAIAPAMNPRMWSHLAVKDNVAKLVERGVHIIKPATGIVACGDFGTGKLAPVEEIVSSIVQLIEQP